MDWLNRRLESILDNFIFAGVVAVILAVWNAIKSLPLPWIIGISGGSFLAILTAIRIIVYFKKRHTSSISRNRGGSKKQPDIQVTTQLSFPKYRASHHVRGDMVDLKLEFDRGEMASDKIICVVESPNGERSFSERNRDLYFREDKVRGIAEASMTTEVNFQYPSNFGGGCSLKKGGYIVTWRFEEGSPLLGSFERGKPSEVVATDQFTIE